MDVLEYPEKMHPIDAAVRARHGGMDVLEYPEKIHTMPRPY